MSQNLKEQSINSFIWKSAQSLCTLGMTFVIQLILARILLPEDFGIVAITTVFMTLANTIIETSFSSAVIQRNTLDQKLISSIFYANLVLSVFVYFVLFFVILANKFPRFESVMENVCVFGFKEYTNPGLKSHFFRYIFDSPGVSQS